MPKRIHTPDQKAALVQRVIDGEGLRALANEAGIPPATLSYWKKKATESLADDGEIIDAFCEQKSKGGRPPAFDLTDEEQCIAQWYRLTKESVDVAAWFFCRDDRVRHDIREQVLSYEEAAIEKSARIAWPMSIRRGFHVTLEDKAAFRGKKASQQTEMITRRGMFEILADGSTRDILPGMVWELDDYSANQPYSYIEPNSGEIMLGRQILGARDLAGAAWLGFDLIGRERDAYRAEDVLRYIERLIQSHGLPHTLRLERGIWESSGVHGIEVDGMADRWGDLRALMRIEHVFKSKSKSIIEGGFNMLQRMLAHTGTDIGRVRGEFEEQTRRFLQAKGAIRRRADGGKSKIDIKSLGFLTQAESSQKHAAAAEHLNQKQMHRGHLNERIAPDDLIARQGWHTGTVPESEMWRFLPCKMLRIVRAGQVEVKPAGGWNPMQFTVNGIIDGIHLENGHKILVACDPVRPDLGAYICNADKSVKNRNGYGMGQFLMTAPHYGLAPQFNASDALSPHLVTRKKASSAAATHYRAIKNAGSQKGGQEITRTDGKDNTLQAGSIERPETNKPATLSAPVDEVVSPDPVTKTAQPSRQSARSTRFSHLSPAERKAEIAKLTKQYQED